MRWQRELQRGDEDGTGMEGEGQSDEIALNSDGRRGNEERKRDENSDRDGDINRKEGKRCGYSHYVCSEKAVNWIYNSVEGRS